jgi:5-aminolevulinate synthase
MACELLLPEHGIHIQPRSLERLLITPSPYRDDALIDHLDAE